VTFNAMSFGPTVEVSSENVGDAAADSAAAPGDKPDAKVAVAKSAGVATVANRPASTQSDLTKNVSEGGSSKGMSPVALGIGAVMLLAIGGAGVYFMQGGARPASSETTTTPESRVSAAPVPAPTPTPTPQVTVASASPAAAARSAEPSSSVAPASTTAPAPSLGKTKTSGTNSKTGATPSATSTTKREGLF